MGVQATVAISPTDSRDYTEYTIRREERESGRQYVSYPPRRIERVAPSTSTDKAT
jgi:hypothetical protein